MQHSDTIPATAQSLETSLYAGHLMAVHYPVGTATFIRLTGLIIFLRTGHYLGIKFLPVKKILLPVLLLLAACTAIAQNKSWQKGLYGNLHLGAGSVTRNFGEGDNTTTRFTMQISGGYFIVKPLMAGITANGWTYEPANYYSPYEIGEFISTTCLFLQVYPLPANRLYLKSGYGFSSYTSEHSYDSYDNGNAYLFAGGYEFPLSKQGKTFLGLEIAYYGGKLSDDLYDDDGNASQRQFHAVNLTVFFSVD